MGGGGWARSGFLPGARRRRGRFRPPGSSPSRRVPFSAARRGNSRAGRPVPAIPRSLSSPPAIRKDELGFPTRPLTTRGASTLAQPARDRQGTRATSAFLKDGQLPRQLTSLAPVFDIPCAPCESRARAGARRTLPAHGTRWSTGTRPFSEAPRGTAALPRETGRRPRSSRPRPAAPNTACAACTAGTAGRAQTAGTARAEPEPRPGALRFRPATTRACGDPAPRRAG